MSQHAPPTFRLTDEVAAARAANAPLVALESTVIAHGLPYPDNLETALRLESLVREAGGVPATVAVLGGVVRIGLEADELRHLATAQDGVRKVSVRDLPAVVARGLDGATTVAATLYLAHRAGLRVFATGGIGGVHRDAPWDVSADLPALATTPLVVVCAGAKSVLDLPATREWLETHGVTVAGYGCDEMPAFYTRTSGLRVDVRVETAADVVGLARAREALGITTALLVTNPVPEKDEISPLVLDAALAEALRLAQENNIGGRELTPFLLARMASHSGGATIKTNIALLENNARVAAAIARLLAA